MANITECRICKGVQFSDVLDLGMTPFADDFLTEDRLNEPEVYMPLRVVMCDKCSLVQLSYVASREALYQADYPYVSSTTESGVRHYHDMAAAIAARFSQRGLAIDIGSNVGVLLDGFKQQGYDVLGIEPAPKIAQRATLRGISTVNEFFSEDLAASVVLQRGEASVVTGTNVIAHIDDLHDLMRGLSLLLARDGVFVFEAPYIIDLMMKCAYDTIYHEHLSYLGIVPIQYLCRMFGFEVFDVEPQKIHGGTLRYFIAREGTHPVAELVGQMETVEDHFYQSHMLTAFAENVAAHRMDLIGLLHDLKVKGYSIAAVSAPAKGMTLLNYCGIGSAILDFVTEKAPLKIGKYTPGTHLPVLPDAELVARQPDFALLLAWNFAEEIMANQPEYRGRFIIPIPKPTVVGPRSA